VGRIERRCFAVLAEYHHLLDRHHRRDRQLDHRPARPAVEEMRPALGDERKTGRRLDMTTA
jgi:hypothetical protein